MISRTIRISNRLGLHARAAARFVELASGYRAQVTLRRGEVSVDGKSILGILTLAAPQGSELELLVEGPDEQQAIEGLSELVISRFGEDA